MAKQLYDSLRSYLAAKAPSTPSLMVPVVLVGVLVLIVILATYSAQRTYQIEAQTWGGQLTFKGLQNDWYIAEGTVCAARRVPDLRNAQPEDAGPCSPARFEDPRTLQSQTIPWREGTRIDFRQASEGGLIVRVLSGGTEELPQNSLLLIPAPVWQGHGALTFSAEVQFGADMGPNARGYLIAGRWEARQMGLATSLFRDVTEVVQSGDLSRGASARIINDRGAEVVSYGHITPAPDKDAGLTLAALSERGKLSLAVQYFGLPEPVVFAPDWMDTVASSPMLIAGAAILTFVLTVMQIGSAVFSVRRGEPK